VANDETAAIPLTLSRNAPNRQLWHKAELGKFYPQALRDAVAAHQAFSALNAKILAQVKAALEVARIFASAAAINPLELALEQALQEIQDFIDGLAGNTTVHAIMIPIQKQYFGLYEPIPADALDGLALTPDYNTLLRLDAYPASVVNDITPDTISFINTAPTALGGNAGFYKELVLSLYDQGDFARPTFPPSYAVTGVAVIFGSSKLTDIYRIAALFARGIKLGRNASLTARTSPVAAGLTAKICPIPTQNRIGVILKWDPVPLVLLKQLFSGEALVVTELIVVRATDPGFRQRWSWQENFSREPSDDLKDLQSNPSGSVKVIARLSNGTSNWVSATGNSLYTRNSYTDDDPSLEIDKSYYYGVYLRVKINGTTQPIGQCSNIVWVQYVNRVSATRLSTPPDWFASPTLIQLFPLVQDILSLLKLLIQKYKTSTTSNSGAASMIIATIEMIERLLQEAERYANLFKELDDLLLALANANTSGIYVTSFDVATGGITAWTSELARRMSNPSDSSRPPFDKGELTAGFVLVAGRPNKPELAGIKALFDLLFGDKEKNVFRDVTQIFSDDPAGQRTPVFDPGMQATQEPALPSDTATEGTAAATSAAAKPKPVFGADMQPSTTLDDC